MDIKTAVRELRKSLGDTQQQFANRLNLAISTVVRYELSREPKGAVLIQFHQLAVKNNLTELAKVFWDAGAEEVGRLGIEKIQHIWSTALNARNLYSARKIAKRNPKDEDLLQALTDIAKMCEEISPVLQWERGDHRKEPETGDNPDQMEK